MKRLMTTVALILMVSSLAGCGRGENVQAAPAGGGGNQAAQGGGYGAFQDYSSEYLTNNYEGALNPMMQLVVGALQLEGTENAVSAEQAAKLLPLWQGISGGGITNGEERNAVLKQIEGAMTATQMQAIADMRLTFEDMNSWAESSGIELPQFGGRGGPGGAFASLTDEQRQELRNVSSPEGRQAKLREFGIEVPEGGFGGGQGGQNGRQGGGQGERGGRFDVLMQPLLEMLESRTVE